jgi:hypothetical protein
VPSAPEDGLLVKIYAAGGKFPFVLSQHLSHVALSPPRVLRGHAEGAAVCHSDVMLLSAETKRAYFLDKYTLVCAGLSGCAHSKFKDADVPLSGS